MENKEEWDCPLHDEFEKGCHHCWECLKIKIIKDGGDDFD
ncbi:MAG: hypothetical protein KatS3mg096_697 [Candidatus Parcubacteria bacterium]|nr:MAG: hypothetical protein KatS3mg096_670 [Candidatus Parcubacteria bacterium]GIW67829.1 MAG: hypothetical protein KatS3mg096_697 [Candidatus Parcubacteria bacterium]